MELFIWWLYDREIVWKEYVDKLFYILHVAFRRWMHSQPSLSRKVRSLQSRTKFAYKRKYKIELVPANHSWS